MKTVLGVLFGVLLLFICSQLTIPTNPIPITMQTVGVMLIALAYSRLAAVLVVSLYLLLGALGLPVFANYHSGLKTLVGPTGGYLWGFLAAVLFMTTFKKYLNNRSLAHIALNCILGTLIILLIGMVWLGFYIGFKSAVSAGFYPFLIPGMIKICVTAILFYLISIVVYKRLPIA